MLKESYKLGFDNENNVIKIESNKMVNGKVVGEPNPNEAISNFQETFHILKTRLTTQD